MDRFIYNKLVSYFETNPNARFYSTSREIANLLEIPREKFYKVCYCIQRLRGRGMIESKMFKASTVLYYRRKV